MAEQNIRLPVSPKTDGGNPRRNSMGGLISSKSGEKGVPNYLRASTGSCHDLCKYGKKHAFEDKARRPFPRRVTKKLLDDQNPVEVQPGTKPSMVNLKHSSKIHTPEIIKWEVSTSFDSETSVSNDVLAEEKKKNIPVEILLTRSADSKSSVLRQVLAKKKMPMQEVLTEPVERRSSASSGIQNEKKTSAQCHQKSSEVKLISSTNSKPSVSPKIMKQDMPSLSKKLQVSLKQVSSKAKEINLSATQARSSKPNLSSPSSSISSSRRNSDINIGQKQDLPRIAVKKVLASPRASLSSRTLVKGNTREVSPRVSLLPKIAIRGVSRGLASPRASLSPKIVVKGVARGLASPRASLSPKIAVKGVARGLASPRASLSPKIAVKGVARGLASSRGSLSPKIAMKEVARGMAPPRASFSLKPSLTRTASLNAKKHRSLKVVPAVKSQNKIKTADIQQSKIESPDTDQSTKEIKEPNSHVVEEKTLYVIKMETDSKYLESSHNEKISVESDPTSLSSPKSVCPQKFVSASSHHDEDEEESEYAFTEEEEEDDDDSFSEYDGVEYMEEGETFEGEHKGINGNARMVSSKYKDAQPVKLHFRRGKVVEIQSENNGPMRLKFRRGRVLGESEILKAEAQKSFKRRGSDGSTNESNPESRKVVLRHQDMQGKKDAQGLFNNVIEETASKLVETRKSKVKALVGAFETVIISLQDNKTPANVDS